MPHTVFVCHSALDKQVADAACAAIESRRIPCWIAPRDVLPGEEWGRSIVEAMNECQLVVLIFSSHSNESPQVRREIERAISKGKTILPFRIEDISPTGAMEYALGNTHWLDALTPPLETNLTRLADSISRVLRHVESDMRPFAPSPGATPAAAQHVQRVDARVVPQPPRMHWGILLLIYVFTLGYFQIIWFIVQARWARRMTGKSTALAWSIVTLLVIVVMMSLTGDFTNPGFQVVCLAMNLITAFTLRSQLRSKPVSMALGGVMTFFFQSLYFQYHLREYKVPQASEVYGPLPLV